MRLFRLNRDPMIGESGRIYRVLGEADVPLHCGKGGERCLTISVTSPGNEHPDWGGHGNVTQLAFYDVQAQDEGVCIRCISEDQAETAATACLIYAWAQFRFQCEAGVSRSAALCVATARHFGDDEVAEECYRRYAPNPLVVERMTTAFAHIVVTRDQERDQ